MTNVFCPKTDLDSLMAFDEVKYDAIFPSIYLLLGLQRSMSAVPEKSIYGSQMVTVKQDAVRICQHIQRDISCYCFHS